jgi:hypothetical protein
MVQRMVSFLFVVKVALAALVLATAHIPFDEKQPGLQAPNGLCQTRLNPTYLLVERVFTAFLNSVTLGVTYYPFLAEILKKRTELSIGQAIKGTIMPFLESDAAVLLGSLIADVVCLCAIYINPVPSTQSTILSIYNILPLFWFFVHNRILEVRAIKKYTQPKKNTSFSFKNSAA